MSAGGSASLRVSPYAVAMGWHRNALLPHVEFTIPEGMREVVRQIPDHVALDDGVRRVTYAELVHGANQVANALLDREPEPGAPIALLSAHGVAPAIGICGVLHAGLIGVPVDAREPLERLQRLLGATGARVAVTDREHVALARQLGLTPVVIDDVDRYGASWPSVEIPEDHPGLVLFTSGSTGAPKGVVTGHRNIVPRSVRQGVKRCVTIGSRHGLTNSFAFAAAENSLFVALLNGATLFTYDLRTRGPRDLPEWVRADEIDAMSFVPATIRALAPTTPPGAMACVRRVGFGADTLYGRDVELARPMFAPDTELRNGLGSTEVGQVATFDIPRDLDLGDRPVPVGTPDPDVEVRLVDEDDEPVPYGEVGRIVVLGRGRLALGYWNDPLLTRRHFFEEPDGRPGFRTPDSGRWRDDGLLEHVGLFDDPERERAIFTDDGWLHTERLGEVACACVVTDNSATVELDDVVTFLRGRGLATYKLSQVLRVVPELPTTPSGKVRKNVLRELVAGEMR